MWIPGGNGIKQKTKDDDEQQIEGDQDSASTSILPIAIKMKRPVRGPKGTGRALLLLRIEPARVIYPPITKWTDLLPLFDNYVTTPSQTQCKLKTKELRKEHSTIVEDEMRQETLLWDSKPLIALLLFISCHSPVEPPLPSIHQSFPVEDRGMLLLSGVSSEFVWSNSGDEMFFINHGLHAINILTRSTRVLDDRSTFYRHLRLSNDGENLYYVVYYNDEAVRPALCRVSVDDGNAEILFTDIAAEGLFMKDLVLSPDGIQLVYSVPPFGGASRDSIFLFNTLTSSKSFLALGDPIAFSPDGKKLLLRDETSYVVLTLEGKATEYLSLNSSGYSLNPESIRWDSQGIRVILPGFSSYLIYSVNTQSSDTIAIRITDDPLHRWDVGNPFVSLPGLSWVPDGRQFGYWTSSCLRTRPGALMSVCTLFGVRLLVVDITSEAVKKVAYVYFPEHPHGIGSFGFSRDSKKVAYSVSNEIYIKDIL